MILVRILYQWVLECPFIILMYRRISLSIVDCEVVLKLRKILGTEELMFVSLFTLVILDRWLTSPIMHTTLDGFFLRLRFGKWEEALGGTGYHVARINGK